MRPADIRAEPASAAGAAELPFSYEGFEALHSVSFCLRRGEIAGLLGPNGAGKTTVVKILAGILSADRGRVVVGGFELTEQHLEAKKIIGFVPEAAGVYESLSGTEFLELSGRLHGIEEKTLQNRIRVLLEAFELDDVRGPRLARYSKGMR